MDDKNTNQSNNVTNTLLPHIKLKSLLKEEVNRFSLALFIVVCNCIVSLAWRVNINELVTVPYYA